MGNPDPLLAISDPDITYFHVVTDKRLDGLPAVERSSRVTAAGLVRQLRNGRPQSAIERRHRGPDLYPCEARGDGDYPLERYPGVPAKERGWRIIHSHWFRDQGGTVDTHGVVQPHRRRRPAGAPRPEGGGCAMFKRCSEKVAIFDTTLRDGEQAPEPASEAGRNSPSPDSWPG